jgi:hypothetical protein
MKIRLIGENIEIRSARPRTYRFTWPYRYFFHGSSRPVVNIYGKHPYKSLPLKRNINLLPTLSFPSITMVVLEGLAGQLADIEHVDLNACTWDAVFAYPVGESDILGLREKFSGIFNDFDEWLESQMRAPAAALNLPTYFQVLAPRHETLSKNFNCDSAISMPSTAIFSDPPTHTSKDLHGEYPLVKVGPYYFCTEMVWKILAPHVSDPDLFTVTEFDI